MARLKNRRAQPEPQDVQPLPSGARLREYRACLKAERDATARAHGFETWTRLQRHILALADKKSPAARFEAAVEAIISGKTAPLKRLLRQDPKLVRARSGRMHRATLLHYVSANGVEGYQQKTPPNIVEIAKMLLSAGARVDAEANAYGARLTTLHLTATSVHPERAGVMNALLELLIDHGATVDSESVLAALGNGRAKAAKFLAEKGAPLTLESAAGVGRLDLVEKSFNDRGELKRPATKRQFHSGFLFACAYGRLDVIEFLLARGADLTWHRGDGQTALHRAVIGGEVETVKLLLRHNPPFEARNVHGGTVLGQALWSAAHGGDARRYVAILDALATAGAKVPDKCTPINTVIDEWLERHGCRSS